MSEEDVSPAESTERLETDADYELSTTESSDAKVIGTIDQADSAGILGVNTASSGATSHGVEGVTDSEDDGVAGVRGEARAAGAGGYQGHESYGVHGITRAGASEDAASYPAGVRGEATGDGVPRGVVGLTAAQNGYGGLFENENESAFGATGLKGVTYSSGTNAAGVEGEANTTSGEVFGVRGYVTSDNRFSAGVKGATFGPEAEGYGVFSEGDTRSEGVFEAGSGVVHEQRGDPGTDELSDGEVMTYNSDGSGTGEAGDLVYAINDGGTIKTTVIVSKSDAT